MMNKKLKKFVSVTLLSTMIISQFRSDMPNVRADYKPVEPEPVIEETILVANEIEPKKVIRTKEIKPVKVKRAGLISEEDIDLIALVTMAEAEGEPEKGKRLVIDTILNRVDSKRHPNTVKKVIYAPHQFSSMWNGRVNRCYVRKDIRKLVKEELKHRTNSEVIYFRTDYYSEYGTPMFRVGNHYFSKYE